MTNETKENQIKQLAKEYLSSFEHKIIEDPDGDQWIKIITPYLDIRNDHIEIYIKQQDDTLFLTDAGETMERVNYLNNARFTNIDEIKNAIESTLRNCEIKKETDELFLYAEKNELISKIYLLIQCIIETKVVVSVLMTTLA